MSYEGKQACFFYYDSTDMSIRSCVQLWETKFSNVFNGEDNPLSIFFFIIDFVPYLKYTKLLEVGFT